MNGDIRPPRPPHRPVASSPQPPAPIPQPLSETPLPVVEEPITATAVAQTGSKNIASRRRVFWWLVVGLLLVGMMAASFMTWYLLAQRPVDSQANTKVSLTIKTGMTPNQIADELKNRQLIRSQLVFSLYTRLHGVQDKLQAGDYRLSPSQDLASIVGQLEQGQAAEFELTFYPGATLYDRTDIADAKRTDVYTMLRRAGYADQEIRSAFAKHYDHPLLTSKPAGASLEGYVYGDTYRFDTNASVESILERTFDEFYQQISTRKLISKLKKQGMTLHEGIILASIIEREVSGRLDDQRQVSQIFHLRLSLDMPLGADATFMYAAQQLNAKPSTKLDSPYNTRVHKGLPPGPISSPNISAVEAAAMPAKGDYLYFVSGDDGRTHFAHTMAEHESNTRTYCTDLCYSIE